MSQNPTDVSPVDSIIEFVGLNDKDDTLYRPKGTVTNDKNVYDEQQHDANRRAGRDFDRLETGPILSIYQFAWDDNAFSLMVDNNGNAKQDTTFVTPANPSAPAASNTPGPMPNTPFNQPIVFRNAFIPDLTSYIRALSESQFYFFHTYSAFRNQIWGIDFYEVTNGKVTPPEKKPFRTNVRDKKTILSLINNHYLPVPNKTYPTVPIPAVSINVVDDFYWVDYFVDKNNILLDVQSIVALYNSIKDGYVKTNPIQGAATIVNFTAADNYNPPGYSFSKKDPLKYWVNILREVSTRIGLNMVRIRVNGIITAVSALDGKGIASDSATISGAVACALANFSSVPYGHIYSYAPGCVFGVDTPIGGSPPVGVIAFWNGFLGNYIELYVQGGTVTVNLTPFTTGSADLYLKLGISGLYGGDFGQVRPTTAPVNTYGLWSNSGIQLGISNVTGIISHSQDVPSQIPVTPGAAISWEVGVLPIAVITRPTPTFIAFPPTGAFNPILLVDYESFTVKPSPNIGNSETFLAWNSDLLLPSGAADRSLYPPIGAYTPSTTIQFSSKAPGFDKKNFTNDAPYRPVIISQLFVSGTVLNGSPTTITVRLYINNTLNKTSTVSLDIPNQKFTATIAYAFSVKGIGDFTKFRPPNNNPADNFDGWVEPAIKISLQTDAGTVTIDQSFRLIDIVVNYPI